MGLDGRDQCHGHNVNCNSIIHCGIDVINNLEAKDIKGQRPHFS